MHNHKRRDRAARPESICTGPALSAAEPSLAVTNLRKPRPQDCNRTHNRENQSRAAGPERIWMGLAAAISDAKSTLPVASLIATTDGSSASCRGRATASEID